MTKKAAKLITVVLCVAIVALVALPTLAACNDTTEETVINGTATPVEFNSQGEYKTTVSADGMNVPSGLGADDVVISYRTVTDEAGLDEALEAEANGGETVDYSKYSETVNATLSDVSVKDGAIEITFSDAQSAQNLPDYYSVCVLLKVKKNKLIEGIFASVEVDYPKVKATPSVSSITSLENELILSLELDAQSASEFTSNITAKNIHLDGAFKGMQYTLESHEPKNLTLKLTGELTRDASDGTYHDGTIRVDASKVKMSKYDLTTYIPIDQISIYLGVSGLKFANGKATVPVYVSGHSFAKDANAADFAFEQVEDYHADPIKYVPVDGVTIERFERTDAHSGTFTIAVEGAQDENDVAEALNGKTLKALGAALEGHDDSLSCSVDLAPASIYAVFDSAKIDGENYVFDLFLNATHGVFNAEFSKDDISFSGDLAGATINAFALTDDETATLQLKVPAQKDDNGNVVSLENMYLKGTISLKEGAMTSRWGKASKQVDCTRAYDWFEMGRAEVRGLAVSADDTTSVFDDALDTLAEFDWTGVFDNVKKIWAGKDKIKSIFEFLGIIEDNSVTIDMIYDYLEKLHEELVALSQKLDEMMRQIDSKLDKNTITTFCKDKLYMLQSYRGYAIAAINDAVATLKTDLSGQIAPSNPAEGATDETLEEWTDYMHGVMQQARSQDEDIFNKLLEYFTEVCGEVVPAAGGESIIATYDNYISNYYNFDVQAYDNRENFRNAIEFEIANSYYILCSYMQMSTDTPQENKISSLTQQFNSVKDYLTNKNPFTRRTDNCFYMYAIKQEVTIKTGYDLISFSDRKNPTDNWGIEPDSEIVAYFNERMRGETIGQMLTDDLGYDQSLDDKKYAIGYKMYRKSWPAQWYKPGWYVDECDFYIYSRTFTDTSITSVNGQTYLKVSHNSDKQDSNEWSYSASDGSTWYWSKDDKEAYNPSHIVYLWLTTEDLYVNSRS